MWDNASNSPALSVARLYREIATGLTALAMTGMVVTQLRRFSTAPKTWGAKCCRKKDAWNCSTRRFMMISTFQGGCRDWPPGQFYRAAAIVSRTVEDASA